ncbi:MAG: tRNA uridine-5-carboxymethylaminomethyl(34) synthesis GTPase MnmE [Spirochaetales bacterium]|nr:tRNA uridine-5-carboxymethylaminomethyl(34) synthesis GTPase MnmE [Spirochaetales bacterium]
MKDLDYNTDECIATLATGWEESAIAVIRTSGSGSITLASKVFSAPKKLLQAEGNTIVYGYIIDPDSGDRVDEVLIAVFKAPKSYTGEDSVEIFGHGGIPAVSGILTALKKAGFRDAAPGEFTMRAFINGKLDLTRAEAVHEIVTAKTKRAHSLAINRLSGALENRIDTIKTSILNILSKVELLLDYPDDELDGQISEYPLTSEEIKSTIIEVDKLAESFKTGKVFREGVPVALAGKTNAGKSSLFNMLLKEDRAIVSEIHGTTRDYIESWITVGGIPLRLFDTAGLRDSENPVEAEGIKRSGEVISGAGIVLYLVDSTEGLTDDDLRNIASFSSNEKLVKIWSKSDSDKSRELPEGFIAVSSVTGEGFSLMEKALSEAALGQKGIGDSVVVDSLRQHELLVRASEALNASLGAAVNYEPIDAVAMELKDALDALGEITGEVSSADILDNIFSNFCLGK